MASLSPSSSGQDTGFHPGNGGSNPSGDANDRKGKGMIEFKTQAVLKVEDASVGKVDLSLKRTEDCFFEEGEDQEIVSDGVRITFNLNDTIVSLDIQRSELIEVLQTMNRLT